MSAILQIERAVSQLPPKELARFREWFEKFDAKLWDKQFEQDAKSGKLDQRANQAIADFRVSRQVLVGEGGHQVSCGGRGD